MCDYRYFDYWGEYEKQSGLADIRRQHELSRPLAVLAIREYFKRQDDYLREQASALRTI